MISKYEWHDYAGYLHTDFTIIWPGSQKMHGTKTGLFTMRADF